MCCRVWRKRWSRASRREVKDGCSGYERAADSASVLLLAECCTKGSTSSMVLLCGWIKQNCRKLSLGPCTPYDSRNCLLNSIHNVGLKAGYVR